MRVCPKCKHHDPDYWRPSFNNNPQGSVDIGRIDEIELDNVELADKIRAARGSVYSDEIFTYYLGKKAVWVKRVWKQLYLIGGMSVFRIPHEKSMRFSAHKHPGQTKLQERKK